MCCHASRRRPLQRGRRRALAGAPSIRITKAECIWENVLLGFHSVPSGSYFISPGMYLSRTLDAANQTTAAVCVFLSRTREASWHLDSYPMVLFLSNGTLTGAQNSSPRGGTAPSGNWRRCLWFCAEEDRERRCSREQNLHPWTEVTRMLETK